MTRYTLNMGNTPNTADGTYLNVDLTLAPEYYASYDKDGNATVDWDALSDGATMHYGMVVDKTAPTVSNVNLGTDAEGNKVLTFTAGDDQYMSAVALLDYDKGSVVSKAAGSPEGAAKGASQNFTLSLNDSKATHLLLQVYDYAENYVTYKLNLNPDELAGDVTVKLNTEALTLFKGNVAKLTASVEPFGVQPDTVTWSSDNTDVATVSDNGLVTAVGKGTANITATSVKDPSVSATCVVTVDTIDVTLVGALRDKEGHPILFTWDMENDKTWTKYADLEQDINSATIDFAHDDGSMYQMNTSGLLYEVNPETGATVSASAAATKYGAPMQDMEYAAIAAIQSQKNILVGVDGAYFLYSDPVMANDFSDGWDMSSYLSTYANASEFTAVAWAGYTTNKAGHTVDVFYCLTDSGTIWIMMPDFETGRASMDWVDTDLKLSFPGYDGSLYCSMVLGDDGNLYLSYFTGETNEIYILKYNETTDSYESSLMGNIGNAVWPCSLLAVSDNHAEDGDADNNSLPGTELNVSSSIEAQSQTMEALTPASVTGSLNTANDAGTGAVKPADAETTTPVSSIAVSEVVPKNDDITTNGLFTVDYDASVLTLADVTFASQYSSHKDADGKVTLGYVDVDGLKAGTAVATLTFTVSDPTAVDASTAVTVHQTEINDQTVDVTEDLTADLHQDTKVVNAKPATCTEDGYTGDTVCAACGKVLAKGEVIKALGHDYKDGTCTRCGDKQPGVNTGDNSTMTMWTMSAVMALAGAAVLVLRSRKEKYEG